MSSGGHPSTGGARAFAQKLSKSNAHDIRLQTAAELKNEANTDAETGGTGHAGIANALARRIGRSSVSSSSSATLSPGGINNLLHPSSASRPSSAGFYLGDSAVPVEPLDYEEYVSAQRHRCGGSGGQDNTFLDRLVDFPVDDIEVNVVPRKIRTLGHVVPEEPLDKLDPSVQNCVEAYTSDWVVVTRRYHHYSSSVRKRQQLQDIFAAESASSTLKHEFELDEAPEYSPTSDTEREWIFGCADERVYGDCLKRRNACAPRRWRRTNLADQIRWPVSLGTSRRSSLLSLSDSESSDVVFQIPSSTNCDVVSLHLEYEVASVHSVVDIDSTDNIDDGVTKILALADIIHLGIALRC